MYLDIGVAVGTIVFFLFVVFFFIATFKASLAEVVLKAFKRSILGEALDLIREGENSDASITFSGYIALITLGYTVYIFLAVLFSLVLALLSVLIYPVFILIIPAYFRAKHIHNKKKNQ